MICKQCGQEIAPDAKFCGVCGAPNDAAAQPVEPQYAQPAADPYAQQYQQPQYQQPQYQQPQYQQPQQYGQPQYGAPVEDPVERSLSKSILVFGILALVFCCTFYLAFLGIIFGAIAMSKAKKYAASYPLTGRAKVGKILGTVGLIIGIIFTVIVTIIIIVAIIAAASYSGSSYSSYYYY